MDDILAKVQEILDDPQKLEGFKNLASSLINGDDKIQSLEQTQSNENDLQNESNNNRP